MKGWVVACLLLVVAGVAVIAHRDACDQPVANRDLAANHLLQAADWRDVERVELACPGSDTARLAGRYLRVPVSEGTALDYPKTLARPALEVRPGHSLYWLNVKDAENLSFIEPGARFDACEGPACPVAMLRVEAMRCSPAGPQRLCEVAVIVADPESAKIAQFAGKPIRLQFRQEAIKGGEKP